MTSGSAVSAAAADMRPTSNVDGRPATSYGIPIRDGRRAVSTRKLIALEKEPMAWEADVKALKTPVLVIAGDADVTTLEHSVALFRLLGGGVMGDMGKPLPASR